MANGQDPSPSPDRDSSSLSLEDYRELCRIPAEEELVEEIRQALEETSCSAVLWVDGLFGDRTEVAEARRTSGVVEGSALYSEFDGIDPGGRLRLHYDLPNLERRANVFLGRGNEREAVEDREEQFSLRSSLPPAESPERWITGLALTPPGRWEGNVHLRVGVRPSTSPTAFVQGRLRQRISTGDWAEWRFRQTVFWESDEGAGVTVSGRYQRLLDPILLLHANATGTLSEASEGLRWRMEPSVYRRFSGGRVAGLRTFLRGETSADVPLREYGIRSVYRRPLLSPSLIVELVAGYSWPRQEIARPRERSVNLGVQLELSFGTRPYTRE